jgi:hypothetical protein
MNQSRNVLNRCLLAALVSLPISSKAIAQWNINSASSSYAIDFNNTVTGVNNGAWLGTGFQATPSAGQLDSDAWAVTGWSDGALAFGGTRTTATTDYTRGSSVNTAVTTGGMYAFSGGNISTGTALGIQPGGSDWAPGTVTLRLQNTTGSTITGFNLSYLVYVRNDQARSSSFNFLHSSDDSTYASIPALDLNSTAAVDALGFVSNSRSTTLSGLSVPNNAFYYLRWSGADVGGSGSRDEFALDSIQLSSIVIAPSITASVTGGSASFGNLLQNATSPSATITLSNSGGATTSIAAGTVSGFVVPAPGNVVNNGGTTTSTITLNTSVPGTYSGNLTYTAQPGSVVSTPAIALSGTVGQATYGSGDSSLNYGLVLSAPFAAENNNSANLSSTSTGAAGSGSPVPALTGTTATLLRYDNTTGGSETIQMSWRTRTAAEATNTGGVNLLSDVVKLEGMVSGGESFSTGTGTFVLQMSYSTAAIAALGLTEAALVADQSLRIGWWDGAAWVTAVNGNKGTSSPMFYNAAFDPMNLAHTTLGAYGVNTGSSTVWAVLNHNSEFAVIPEPSSMVLGGLAMLGLASYGLRHRRCI